MTTTATTCARVLLVDDHEVVRDGIKALLAGHADLAVVGEAATARQGVAEAERLRPDVVVMDARLPDGSGVEATREIRARNPAARVLILTSFADDEALLAAVMAGAAGYVLKQVRGVDLVGAVRAVAQGHNLLDAAATDDVLARVRAGKRLQGDGRLASLSPREERVLERLADGWTNREISQELGLTEKTVKNYVSHVLVKLGVGHRAAAAAYLARHTPTLE